MFLIQKYKNKVLFFTSYSFLFSFIFFLIHSNKNYHECTLSICLIMTYIFSQLFWYNAIRYSLMHKIDAIIAKTSILYFIIYTLICKNMTKYILYSYYIIILSIFIIAYLSNYYSSKEWCSNKHIFYHMLLHILCFIGTLYTFLEYK